MIQALSFSLEFSISAKLDGHQPLGLACLWPSRWDQRRLPLWPASCVSVRALNSIHHICASSALPTKVSLQPLLLGLTHIFHVVNELIIFSVLILHHWWKKTCTFYKSNCSCSYVWTLSYVWILYIFWIWILCCLWITNIFPRFLACIFLLIRTIDYKCWHLV